MNPKEQKAIVMSITERIREFIIGRIESGDIPPEWEGWELRQLIADQANSYLILPKRPARMRAYKKIVSQHSIR